MLFGACGGDTAAEANSGAAPSGGAAQTPTPRAVDLSKVPDEQLIERVLDECHRTLQHRMRNVRVAVTGLSEGDALLQARLPLPARVRLGDGNWLVRDDGVHRLDEGDAPPAAAERLRRLVRLVDVAAFGPLYRATGCRRVDGPASYRLEGPDGPTVLHLRPGTLLPLAIERAGERVTIDDYLRTRTTWVPNRLTSPALGGLDVVFEDGGISFAPDLFDLPSEIGEERPTQRIVVPGAVIETPSPTPIVVALQATRVVLLDDPGTWTARHERYGPVHDELEAQDQKIAGFPLLFELDGRRVLGAPFRQRDDGAALEPPADWVLRDEPAGKLLVVYPPEGSVDERIATGISDLQRALANRGLRALGPITAQPYLHLDEGAPSAEKLADARVRVFVRIE